MNTQMIQEMEIQKLRAELEHAKKSAISIIKDLHVELDQVKAELDQVKADREEAKADTHKWRNRWYLTNEGKDALLNIIME